MGNYLYDDYEAKMKVTNDVINDWNFYTKLTHNFVSPKKIFKLVQVIFVTNKSPPYHTKFLQVFYNNLNILERDENFHIVEELYTDLSKNLTFHEAYNNFNQKLCDIKTKNRDRSIFNHGLVRTKEDVLKEFFLYVNFHRNEFEKIKKELDSIVKEIQTFPEKLNNNQEGIKKIEYEERLGSEYMKVTYIGQLEGNAFEGKGMLVKKNKSNGKKVYTYIGQFKDNKRHGLGLVKIENNQFEGQFCEDKLDGKGCSYLEDAIIYYEYEKGLKNGRCISLYKKSGNIETTSYIKDKQTEINSQYLKTPNFIFTGKKMANIYEGVIYYDKGNVDVGFFNSDFKLTGEGYFYKNYNGFYCKFNNGKITPSLAYEADSDGDIYNGKCDEKGSFHGEKVMRLIYGNENEKGDLFLGTVVHGKVIGYGEYYWGHGDYMKSIRPKGWGVRYVNDEEPYYMEGYFPNSSFPKGPGLLTYNDVKYSGEYFLNEKRCLFISDNNKAFKVLICNDARFNEAIATQFKTEVNN